MNTVTLVQMRVICAFLVTCATAFLGCSADRDDDGHALPSQAALNRPLDTASDRDNQIRAAEQTLGTGGKTNSHGHDSLYAAGSDMSFPGIIVCVEKAERDTIGATKDRGLNFTQLANTSKRDRAVTDLKKHLDDKKGMFVSHIIDFTSQADGTDSHGRMLYNAYAPLAQPVSDTYIASERAIAHLSIRLRQVIDERKATHVFIFVHGWLSDERGGFKRLNSFCEAADRMHLNTQGSSPYRPLYIGIAWHSIWKTLVPFSYANRSNDADEVGVTILNPLIHRAVLPAAAAATKRPVVIAVGHSFGGRVVTWGALGGPLLDPPATDHVDAIVGLKAAFPVDRFIPGTGREGSPFATLLPLSGVPRAIYTVSKFDKSLPKQLLTNMIGEDAGWKTAENNKDKFYFSVLRGNGVSVELSPIPPGETRKPILIRADDSIADHSDVTDPALFRMIDELVRPSTGSSEP